MAQTVAFVGIGAMGGPMAMNLLKAGFEVTAYNRTSEKLAALKNAGARTADRHAAAVTPGGIVVTMVSNDQVLKELVAGDGGVAVALGAGTHISMSTISPDTARELANLHSRHGGRYLAAPVFGRPEAAAAAKLWICQSGAAKAKQAARPLLEAMGQSVRDFGDDPGAANLVKLCGNFMILSAVEAMSEAFALAEKNGIDRAAVAAFFGETLFGCPIYQNYGRIVANRAYEPAGFQLALGMKDVKLVRGAADSSEVPMALAELLHERLSDSIAKGRSRMDWTAIELIVAEAAGLRKRESP
jgi:3-hydroxyisobutyrate dehydrogenase-like beta-hydroxyacid dehydrogenase